MQQSWLVDSWGSKTTTAKLKLLSATVDFQTPQHAHAAWESATGTCAHFEYQCFLVVLIHSGLLNSND
jgi:hypothetical protein